MPVIVARRVHDFCMNTDSKKLKSPDTHRHLRKAGAEKMRRKRRKGNVLKWEREQARYSVSHSGSL